VAALAEQAEAGVCVRICLCDSDASGISQRTGRPENSNAPRTNLGEMLAVYAPLHEKDQVQIRQRQGSVYSSIYYADEQFLISQHAYGIPPGQAPVLHLRRHQGGDGEMMAAYLDAFEYAWLEAGSAE
jgi:hypothetical protein